MIDKVDGCPHVRVLWRDACADGSWYDLEGFDDPPEPCVSVGYHLGYADDYLCLAGTMGGDQASSLIYIPAECVIQIEEYHVQQQ